ncbi:MAG: radical SAM protein [Actinomycetia bacterium]|nr:radical SAM protein [Actinomycetes bacterium]
MSDLLEKTKKLFFDVNRTNGNGIKEYLIISDFGNSSVASEPGFVKKYFRIFTPVKSYKGRRLNAIYGESFNSFKDTLMDYPTIVQYKMGKVGVLNWKNYNRLISLHVSRCPLNCWHCYIEECLKCNCNICTIKKVDCNRNRKNEMYIKEDWFSAKKIVESFIEQRNLNKGKECFSNTNILRITGGEPFLVPDLLLEILEELKNKQLHKEAFLWAETNLIPLIVQENNRKLVPDEVLDKLAKYDNFCVHPCFHGVNQNNFEEVTGQTIDNFNFLLNAFERLLNAGIDIYPTFGSNMSSPEDVECFYNKISGINELLPLRFCLIEYDLDYNPIKWRRKNISNFPKDREKVYDRFQVIEKWDELLKKNTGYKYGVIPRHLVPIEKGGKYYELKK